MWNTIQTQCPLTSRYYFFSIGHLQHFVSSKYVPLVNVLTPQQHPHIHTPPDASSTERPDGEPFYLMTGMCRCISINLRRTLNLYIPFVLHLIYYLFGWLSSARLALSHHPFPHLFFSFSHDPSGLSWLKNRKVVFNFIKSETFQQERLTQIICF